MSSCHLVDLAADGLTGLSLAQSFEYDLILLDVSLPKLDGISLCRNLRASGCKSPIMFLTARGSSSDIVLGLDAGADDYIVKPFYPDTLMARIRAIGRRSGLSISTPVLTWGDLFLDPSTASVVYRQQEVGLTSKEYSLLELFLRNPRRVFSRSAILDRLWSLDYVPTENAVTNLIKDLRRKLRAAGMANDLIETVYGLGYRVKVESRCSRASSRSKVNAPVRDLSESNSSSVQEILNRFRDTFIEQVIAISEFVASLETGSYDCELLDQALSNAHKLAGGLGTFGWEQGSAIARKIEILLDESDEIQGDKLNQLAILCRSLQAELTKPSHSVANISTALTPFSTVLIIDDDSLLTEKLCVDGAMWGVQVEVANSPAIARQKLANQLPDVILLDLTFPDSDEDGLALLESFSHQIPHIPVLVLTGRDSLENRVSVSRLGGHGFLHKPVFSSQIFEKIIQHLPSAAAVEGNVMVVDDNPSMLTLVANLLRPWGLSVRPLQDPTQFWDVLTQFQPEVLILDIAMPTFSGIDLCRVVRQDRRWGDLPILVMTAYTDSESLRDVFAAGGDDFIGKPIIGPELVTRVLSRIERVQSSQ